MKKIKYILLSIFAAGTVSSCSFLDKEPYKITPDSYFQDESQASTYLTGIYAIIGQSSFYGGDYMLLAGGDDLTCYAGSTGRVSTSGLICNLATTSDPAVTALWFTLYNGIERANYFIEQIDQMTNISDAARAQYKSEARFLRAFYYFNLVQNWGDVPFKTESTMSTESLSNKDLPRTPKDEIYKFIVDEMSAVADEEIGGLKSAEELDWKPGRVSKSAAWGMLARVYMFWAGEHYRDNKPAPADKNDKFRKAIEYAERVVNKGKHELSDKYWDIFIDMCSDKYDTSGKHESIWEAEFAGDGTGDVRAEGRIGNTNGIMCPDFSSKTDIVGKNDPGYAYAFLWATPKLYDLYGYVMPYGKNLNGEKPTWNGIGDGKKPIVRDDRFIWNIAPFTYRKSSASNDTNSKAAKGVVGRTFECKDLYYWVMSEFEDKSDYVGYGSKSYEYGFIDEVFSSVKHNVGDLYKTTPANEGARNNLSRDLCAAKFRREYEPATKKNKNNTSINFPIMRYSDVLLMLAEAENEVNGLTDKALRNINEVRERAGICKLEEVEGYQGNPEYFRNAIKDERAREFCFEFTRRYDLIRWGDYIENMHALISRTGEKYWKWGTQVATFFNIPESYNYFPIPESEMSVNKLITTNNPGW